MRNRSKWILCMGLAFTMAASVTLSGCGTGKKDSGKTEIELVQYKPEAVKAFEKLEEKFNATHDDIHLTIESPNDAMTVLKTRFIREDNPDIIGIGGDVNLCQEIQDAGIQPLYFGFKDTWTCLAPWNSIAVDLAPADVCRQVNQGNTTFAKEYKEVADRMLELIQYGPDDPFAYDYNGACTAFAKGEAAMYPIGSYAIPQIQSVNPDMDIDSFVTPASNDPSENKLNSGVDLQFCVMDDCENKEAAYEVLDFLLEDENIQTYLDDQKAVPCKEGDFTLPSTLDGMKEYIEEGRMADYQDHYYPTEMAVDAQIQTFLMKKDKDAFLKKFDTDWTRYNRDIIRKVQDYEEKNGEGEN